LYKKYTTKIMPLRPEIQIANRLYFSKEGEARHARPAIRVALAGIIVGVMVMILTICIVVGFKQTVTAKVAGFGAHIQLVSFDNNNTYDLQPIEVSDSLLARLTGFEHVRAVAPFVTKPGMLKTDSAFHGMVLKGTDYWDFFANNIVDGVLPEKPNEVLVSRPMARQMGLSVGESVNAYFVDDTEIRARRFVISGLYETGFGQFDELFIISQLSTAQRLLNQPSAISHQPSAIVSGVEILVDNTRYLNEVADRIYFATVNHLDEDGYNVYYVQTLEEQNPAVFAWLDLLDMNVVVIIILMLLVAGFNIVSGLIILILDGVQLIGTLKALGADNRFVRRIFIAQATLLIGKGVLYGNLAGFALAAIQYFGHLIPLDSAAYYVSYVPIAFPWGWLIALNILTIGVSVLILLLPSMIITQISPAKVMHFE
jgi:lipoprotein-releasing system permease protein